MIKRIKFGEFEITQEHRDAITETLNSGWLTLGPRVKEFEKRMGSWFDYRYVTGMTSGTTADTAMMMALYEMDKNVKIGDEIIVPALSFVATQNSVRAAGFKPICIDVELDTMNIDVDRIEEQITPKTRAIMAVGLMGIPPKLDRLRDICNKYRIPLLLDYCEAYGSKYKGGFGLDYGDMESWSHYVAHICTVSGEFGCVASTDAMTDDLLKSIRSHGREPGSLYFTHDIYGLNFKPTDLAATIGCVEAKYFRDNYNKRKQNLLQIIDATKEFSNKAWMTFEPKDCNIAPHGFNICCHRPEDNLKLRKYLDVCNIEWKRTFGSVSQHKAFSPFGYSMGDFPNAELLGDSQHIGCHQYLTSDEVDYICFCLIKFLKGL